MNSTEKQTSFILAVHYRIDSAPQALRDYLRLQGINKLLYISHPLPIKDTRIEDDSFFELTDGSKIIKTVHKKRTAEHILKSTFLDFLYTCRWVFQNGTFDVFIGVDNLNALAGIFLKKLGKVKKVVYFAIDYFPTRFENKLLNSIYHRIDKFCVMHADEVWNVSPVMVSAREKHNNLPESMRSKQYTLPIGIWFDKAPRKDFKDIDKKKLIFTGHLVPHMGVDLVLQAMPELLKKIPGVHVEIIGGGEEEQHLKEIAEKLHIEKQVKFWGWVRDRKKLEQLLSDAAVGLAPFNTTILDEKVKNADPGKIKDYMLLGLPVIVTDAISTAEAIKKSKSGIVISYNLHEFITAVVQLLGDEKRLFEYREKALSYVKQFDYPMIFSSHIKRIISHE